MEKFEVQFLSEVYRLGKSRPLKEINAEAGVGLWLSPKRRLMLTKQMHKRGWIVIFRTKKKEWWVRPTPEGRKALRRANRPNRCRGA